MEVYKNSISIFSNLSYQECSYFQKIMNMLENYFRRILWKIFFSYVGVKKLYKEFVFNNTDCNTTTYHRAKIMSLLSHVNTHNPFFKNKFTEFIDNAKKLSDLDFFKYYETIPVMKKTDYAQAGQSVMDSDMLNKIQNNALNFDKGIFHLMNQLRGNNTIFSIATGGSTSVPLPVYMDKVHAFTMLFTFFKCWYHMGWKPGDKLLVFYPNRVYDLENFVKINNKYKRLTGLHFVLFDNLDLNSIKNIVEEINTFKPKLLLVFPSPLNIIAHYIRKFNLKLNYQPPLINVSGETFFACQRDNIREIFSKSKIEDSYGSVELGEIAHESKPGVYEVFQNIIYIESIPNKHNTTELIGTIHGLTTFPFIRYKMGDVVTILRENDNPRYMTKIQGKDSTFLHFQNGSVLYPLTLNEIVNEINNITGGNIIDIRAILSNQQRLAIHLILKQSNNSSHTASLIKDRFVAITGLAKSEIQVEFRDIMDHDYRLKYRAILNKSDDLEFAGGIIGQKEKMQGLV